MSVTAITAHGRFGGLLSARFPGNHMAELTVRVRPAEQHAVVSGFPRADLRAVFDRGDVRIETVDGELVSARRNARAAFAVGSVAPSVGTRWTPRTSPDTRPGTT